MLFVRCNLKILFFKTVGMGRRRFCIQTKNHKDSMLMVRVNKKTDSSRHDRFSAYILQIVYDENVVVTIFNTFLK